MPHKTANSGTSGVTLGSVLFRSPQEVDPLSWFTRPFLPVTFAIAMAVGGTLFVLGTQAYHAHLGLEFLAVACFILACLSIHGSSGSRLVRFRWWHAIVPLVLSWLGAIASGVAVSGGSGEPSRWWAPIGVALVLAALAPFSSAVLLVGYGLLGTVVCGLTSALAFSDLAGDYWPPFTIILLGALTPLQATVAAALFSAFIVDRVTRWSDLPIQATLVGNTKLDFSQWNAQRGELKLLSDQVMPFIEQVARDGFVNSRDRTVAATLAKEVRDALIHTVDQTWLDSLADGHRLTVVDPSHRAGRLTLAQRGAVRSLILAVVESPALVADSLAIELRDSDDGGVAVALTMKLDLPEGKRLMMLAPYYLTLQATVDDLVWEDQEQLYMRFQIPSPERNKD